MELIWLIPLLPAAGALLNGVLGIRSFGKGLSGVLACGTMAAALGLSVVAVWELVQLPPESRSHTVVLASWIPQIPLQLSDDTIGAFTAEWAFRLDPLSALMILVVTGIGLLIHVYATGYMHDEPRPSYARFFSYLNLFCFFMLTLVLASNFLVMFVGWEGVGLCSYLLIGYWYEKKSASDAGTKAFIVNRIGDWGFLLGIFLTFVTFGSLDFQTVSRAAAALPVETEAFGVLSLICLLLFIGATGKSAQIPLHVWLPDAMEGPTPVSALIHAATMVTAGVYMVGRNAVLFSHAPQVMEIVAIIGLLTALMAATIGLVQVDIKRVLAYSTVSQLGYMFLGMGVGAFAAGVFHLMTHAFFKALLFLGSGSVIHAMAGEQDMRKMGALRAFMPITFMTMLIGAIAIAGIPPFSGFFSKDEILLQTFMHNKVMWVVASITAMMTAFYMFRLIAMTFLGTYRGRPFGGSESHATGHHADHAHGAWHGPHEAPRVMTLPLILLAVGAALAGFVGIPAALGGSNAIEHFLEPSFKVMAPSLEQHTAAAPGAVQPQAPESHTPAASVQHGASGQAAAHLSSGAQLGLMALSVLLAALGIAVALHFYHRRPDIPDRLATRWAGAHGLLFNKYYFDEVYDATAVRGTVQSSQGLWQFDARVVDGAVNGAGWMTVISSWISHMIDKYVVDGAVNFVGWSAAESSYRFRRWQTGLVQNYALFMLFGVGVFLSIYLILR